MFLAHKVFQNSSTGGDSPSVLLILANLTVRIDSDESSTYYSAAKA